LIMKFFLHISKAEQIERFRARLEKPHKRWKFNTGDLETHAKWDHYMAAYQQAISETSTEYAPWHVIPSDRKWYRNLVIGNIIVEKLKALQMSYPPLEYDPATIQLPKIEEDEASH